MLLAIYFAVGALAAACKTDGKHAATCASGKCEVVGQTEVCTQCKAGGVPIDGFCRPSYCPRPLQRGAPGMRLLVSADRAAVSSSCSGAGATRQDRNPVMRYARKLREGSALPVRQTMGYSRTQRPVPLWGASASCAGTRRGQINIREWRTVRRARHQTVRQERPHAILVKQASRGLRALLRVEEAALVVIRAMKIHAHRVVEASTCWEPAV